MGELADRLRDPDSTEHAVANVLAWLGKAAAFVIEVVGYCWPD